MQYTICITIKGRVQGVFYRQSAKEQALKLNLRGTVQNNVDATVTIVATGTKDALEQLVKWCHTGPSRAVVEDVNVQAQPLTIFPSFNIIR